MSEVTLLRATILEQLSQVIDPETGVDVVRMRLIEDLKISAAGEVACVFRPSSPFCPIAIPLSLEIQKAITEVQGVTNVQVEIVGFLQSEEFTRWLKEGTEET